MAVQKSKKTRSRRGMRRAQDAPCRWTRSAEKRIGAIMSLQMGFTVAARYWTPATTSSAENRQLSVRMAAQFAP